jgi:hypothetical protein
VKKRLFAVICLLGCWWEPRYQLRLSRRGIHPTPDTAPDVVVPGDGLAPARWAEQPSGACWVEGEEPDRWYHRRRCGWYSPP